ncbi:MULTISPECIES: hypothetical protein [Luteimonas]|uniref:hypothetical protein n=1 Tax=Luteimonas TaxID=83614 RepID=UPI000C7A67C8|nr:MULTISPECIES: hypothetical protein [Luteimonas]
MRAVHTILIAAALTLATPAFAQQVQIEDQMSPADRQATGLDKLSETELARLNDWLARRASGRQGPAIAADGADLETRLAEAREEGRREATEARRGIAVEQSREPIESMLPGAFEGFRQGRQYTLANGQVWRQTNGASIGGARGTDVAVRIRPGLMDAWWMKAAGYNTEARVERVK